MKNIFISILFSLFLISIAQGQHKDRYVVVLSMDAFRHDLANNAYTPTLDSLKKVGVYSEPFPCFPSVTFPNHYAMATGLHPDHHGIVNNKFFDKKLNRRFNMMDRETVYDSVFWKGEPVWKTVQKQGLKSAIFMWVGCEIKSKELNPAVFQPYDGSVPYKQRTDWVLEQLNQPNTEDIPNLVMWYFEEPDAIQHKYGTDSKETKEKVEMLDRMLKYFFDNVRKSKVYDKIDFVVLADHGMTNLYEEKYINLYPLLDSRRIKDFIPGVTFFIEPEEDYVDQAYEILSKVPNMTTFRRDKFPARYNYGSNKDRIPEIVIVPEIGYTVDFRAEDKPRSGGAHGFDPFHRDMHMIFYASGPHFKKNYLQTSFQIHNIYGLISHLLGVTPAPNDGNIKDIEDMFSE